MAKTRMFYPRKYLGVRLSKAGVDSASI